MFTYLLLCSNHRLFGHMSIIIIFMFLDITFWTRSIFNGGQNFVDKLTQVYEPVSISL